MRSDRESVQDWYERAIVVNSLAAAQEEELADAGNSTARRVARKRADEAAADLKQALAAVQAGRQAAGDTGTPTSAPPPARKPII